MTSPIKNFSPAAAAAILLSTAALFGRDSADPGLKLPAIFSDNMVFQRGAPVPVWGTAAPGETVSVKFKGQEMTGKADNSGKWMVRLAPMDASENPEKLTVSAEKNQITFDNILVGEVWLCSGQSNMESSFKYLKISDEIKDISIPRIRLTSGAKWRVCDTESLQSFSAVGYYFGLNLWKELKVPVGLINISRGCSSIEAWMTPESLEADKSLVDGNGWRLADEMKKFQDFKTNYDKLPDSERERVFLEHCRSKYSFASGYLGKDGKIPPGKYKSVLWHMTVIKPAYLYNTLIEPLVPFAIKGAVWYQGETNADETGYAQKQKILAESWRKNWGEGNFPFYFVQIAPYSGYSKLTAFWLQQYEAARIIPNSGIVSTVDVSDLKDCHPLNKRDVGLRLALLALRDSYGKKDVIASGPAFKSVVFNEGKALVSFDNIGGGLTTKDGKAPDWFEIAGADRKFVKAPAEIQGAAVAVSSPDVKAPAFVRCGWSQSAEPNLRNKEGLPVFPFNTAEPFFQSPKK
jgi:sialate O-acetylesterase